MAAWGRGCCCVVHSGSGVTPSRLIAKPKLPLFDIGPSQHLTTGIRMIPPPGAKGHDRIEAHDNCQCQEPCLPEYAPKGWGHGNSGEYLPSVHESWGLISTPQKLGIMVYACHPSTLETEGGLEAQGHPCACNECKASLGYIRFCLIGKTFTFYIQSEI